MKKKNSIIEIEKMTILDDNSIHVEDQSRADTCETATEDEEIQEKLNETTNNPKIEPAENKMGVLPVKGLMFNMAWPAILSMTINALYNIVDSIFVSNIQGYGDDPFTAVSIVTPIHFFLIAVAVGSGVGINSLIARKLGARSQKDADKTASIGIRIGVFNYLIFLAIGVFFADIFVKNYAEEGTFLYDSAKAYLQIICIGSAFVNVQIVIEKILQATGNMLAPMACSITGAIVNIILDPILIYGLLGAPEMGVAGAAIATVIGQVCGFLVGIYILKRKETLVCIKLSGYKVDWRIVADIYRVGLPSIVMQSIGSVMLIFYNKILCNYSQTAIAVLGAYFKIQSFIFMPVFGLNQGAMPVIGYNFGARNKSRVMEAYKVGLVSAIIIMALGTVMFQIIPDKLLGMFNASEEMYRIGIPALRIISICFVPAAFGIMTGTMFQATGHGIYSLVISLVRQLFGILPICYLIISRWGVTASWASFPLAEILGMIVTTIFFIRLYNKEIKNLYVY